MSFKAHDLMAFLAYTSVFSLLWLLLLAVTKAPVCLDAGSSALEHVSSMPKALDSTSLITNQQINSPIPETLCGCQTLSGPIQCDAGDLTGP